MTDSDYCFMLVTSHTGSIGLINHWLNDSSSRVDEPDLKKATR